MHKTARLVQVKAGPADGLEEGQFAAYASVFGNKDSYGDVVMPGAFTDTLAEWAAKDAVIPVLYGHEMRDPDMSVGWVIEAKEDEHGLLVTGQIDLEGPKGAQVYRLIKGRRVTQMSFAYDIIEGGSAESEELGGYYELRKLRLYEVSIVPVGANDQTEILAVKHLTAAVKAGRVLADAELALREARDSINSALAKSGEGGHNQDEASSTEPAGAADDDPDGEKSSEPEPMPELSVDALLATLQAAERL